MKIREIMHADVKSCSPDSALDTVALAMWNNDCGAVPIVDSDGRPIGIVTDRDIAMGSALQHKPLWDIKSKEIARGRKLFSCRANSDIAEALELMKKNQVRRLPVVDEQGKLIGMLSIGDVVTHTAGKQARGNTEISPESTLDALRAVVVH